MKLLFFLNCLRSTEFPSPRLPECLRRSGKGSRSLHFNNCTADWFLNHCPVALPRPLPPGGDPICYFLHPKGAVYPLMYHPSTGEPNGDSWSNQHLLFAEETAPRERGVVSVEWCSPISNPMGSLGFFLLFLF